jgi:hypothetical protein
MFAVTRKVETQSSKIHYLYQVQRVDKTPLSLLQNWFFINGVKTAGPGVTTFLYSPLKLTTPYTHSWCSAEGLDRV